MTLTKLFTRKSERWTRLLSNDTKLTSLNRLPIHPGYKIYTCGITKLGHIQNKHGCDLSLPQILNDRVEPTVTVAHQIAGNLICFQISIIRNTCEIIW